MGLEVHALDPTCGLQAEALQNPAVAISHGGASHRQPEGIEHGGFQIARQPEEVRMGILDSQNWHPDRRPSPLS